ncbi:nucleotidyltransferase family protein [Actinoplanes sp. ATCC 53533]|uniref:nucleotidyltransferase family protein n=1 Tax=Actinoplanes sp. ATCC 53533 TaxID=1288362 RepID=UPI001F2F4D31|nr:nucleotidyltransferase family protein [Actinoplanes sp. ATCC 53533]
MSAKMFSMVRRAAELTEIIGECDWFVSVLTAVRAAGLPSAWTGAGVLRDLVWGRRYGDGFAPGQVRDVDVAFFDPEDLSRRRDAEATTVLREILPDVVWEATNQAAVHTWYSEFFGGPPVAPLRSTAEGVATWPETATAVAVRLVAAEPPNAVSAAAVAGGADTATAAVIAGRMDAVTAAAVAGGADAVAVPVVAAQRLEVCAPCGLDDLLDGIWRHNPRRITVPLSRARLARQQPSRRWPGIRVIDP